LAIKPQRPALERALRKRKFGGSLLGGGNRDAGGSGHGQAPLPGLISKLAPSARIFWGTDVTSREAIETLTPGLRRYARALTGLGNGADEIVQATLMRTLEEERRWRDDELKMRVYATLTQLNRQRQRAQAARRQREAPAGRGGAPAKAASRREAISKALDVLATEEREALLLVVLEGFSYQEAAEIIGAPKATLVARLMRARAALAAVQGGDPRFRAKLSSDKRSAAHLRVVK
jgi:RNA polymerase sigma-70 factor (ECF subfamily)